jgi:hypothetical protein
LLQLGHGQRRRRRFTSSTTAVRTNFFTNDSGGNFFSMDMMASATRHEQGGSVGTFFSNNLFPAMAGFRATQVLSLKLLSATHCCHLLPCIAASCY